MYVFMSWKVFNTSRSKKIRIQNSRQLLNCGQCGHSPLCLIFYSLLLILVFRLTYSNFKTLKIPWALLLKPSLTHGDLTVNYFLISSFTAASQNLVELPTLKDRNYRKNSNISLELQSYQASEIQRLYKSAASASLPSVSHALPGDSQEMWLAQPPLSPWLTNTFMQYWELMRESPWNYMNESIETIWVAKICVCHCFHCPCGIHQLAPSSPSLPSSSPPPASHRPRHAFLGAFEWLSWATEMSAIYRP